MSVSSFRVSRLQPLAAAAALLFICQAPAHAATTVTAMKATGSYQLGTDPLVTLLDDFAVSGSSTVDVLSFPSSSTGLSSAGLHSYGSTDGNFGSRSSGSGVYAVTGGFSISLTITNDTATAQNVDFSFYITPGYLNNQVVGFSPTQYIESGASFKLTSASSTLFSSQAVLHSDATGTTFNASGTDTSFYSGAGAFYAVNGTEKSIDLGVLNAGESISLTYELGSYARGDAVGVTTLVPGYTVDVPEQWVNSCDGGYDYGLVDFPVTFAAAADVDGPAAAVTVGSCTEVRIPAHQIEVPGYETGSTGGSGSSSGDPFNVSFYQGEPQLLGLNAALPPTALYGVQMSPVSAVPEPSTYALMLLGLAGLGAVARRRKSA